MNSNISDKLYYYSLLFIAITIPFQWKYLPFTIGIIVLGIIWLFNGRISTKIKIFFNNSYAIFLSSLYIIYLISLVYSENKEYAYIDLLLKLPLLLLPLFLSTSEVLKKTQILIIIKAFAISTFFAALITFGIGYFNYIKTGMTKYFFYHDLEIFMHSAYYALYALFAITTFIFLYIKTENKKSKLAYSSMAFLLSGFLFLLSSRMQIGIFIILLTSFIIARAIQKKRIFTGIIALFLSYACIFLLITKMPKINERLQQTKQHIKNINYSQTNSDPRVQIWKAALNVLKQNYAFGAGVGDAKDVLINEYRTLSEGRSENQKKVAQKIKEIKNNEAWFSHIKQKSKENNISIEDQLFEDAIYVLNDSKSRYKLYIKNGYNYHGQFLQTLSSVGLLGVFILIFSLLIPAYNLGLKNKNYLLLVFAIIVSGSLITESMLERQAGVIFFAFFYCLLIFNSKLIANKSS